MAFVKAIGMDGHLCTINTSNIAAITENGEGGTKIEFCCCGKYGTLSSMDVDEDYRNFVEAVKNAEHKEKSMVIGEVKELKL